MDSTFRALFLRLAEPPRPVGAGHPDVLLVSVALETVQKGKTHVFVKKQKKGQFSAHFEYKNMFV